MTQSKDCQVIGSCGSQKNKNSVQEEQEARSYQGGWRGQEQQEAWGSQGHQGALGGGRRLSLVDQSGNSGLADSTFPEQAFSNVLSHVEGARRGFSARGPEKQLFGPRKALGGGMKRGAWSSGGPPAGFLALINQLD